jgi:hypothetical protein
MSDDIGKAVVTHLESIGDVTDVVGAGDDARIYPEVLPQDPTYPAIVLDVPSNVSEGCLGGSAGLAHARVRIDCYALARATANALAEIIRTKGLRADFRGAMGDMTIRGIELEAGPFYAAVQPRDGGQQWVRIARQDFKISYKQTLPG